MQLTDEQKLEMTETIARAMGLSVEVDKGTVYTVKQLDGCGDETFCIFRPFLDWNDAMRAADQLGVEDILMRITEKGKHRVCPWLFYEDGSSKSTPMYGPDRLTAFCLALHEIAKAKLEEE